MYTVVRLNNLYRLCHVSSINPRSHMSVLSLEKTIVNHHHVKTTSTRQSLDATIRSEAIVTNQTRLDTVVILYIDRNKSPTSSGLEDSISIDYREALLSCSSRGHAENSVVKQRADSEYARLSRPNSHCNNAKTPGDLQQRTKQTVVRERLSC
jgi:hypothetical protein